MITPQLKNEKGCNFASFDAFLSASDRPTSIPLIVLLDENCHGTHDYDRDVVYNVGSMTHKTPMLSPDKSAKMPLSLRLSMIFGNIDPIEQQRGFSVVPIDTMATWINRLGDPRLHDRTVKTTQVAIVTVPSDAQVFARYHCAVVDRLIVHEIVSVDEFFVPSKIDMCLNTDPMMRRFIKDEEVTEERALQIARTTKPIGIACRSALKDIPNQSLAICKAFVMGGHLLSRLRYIAEHFPHCKFFDQELCTYAVTFFKDEQKGLLPQASYGAPHLMRYVPEEYRTDDLIDGALGTPGTPFEITTTYIETAKWVGSPSWARACALGCLSAEQQTPERVEWVLSLKNGGTDRINEIKVPLSKAQWIRALEIDGRVLEHLPAEFRTPEMFKIALLHPTQEYSTSTARTSNLMFMTEEEQARCPDIVSSVLCSDTFAFRYRFNPTEEECIRAGVYGFRDWKGIGISVTPLIQEACDFFDAHVSPTCHQPSGHCSSLYGTIDQIVIDVNTMWEEMERKKEDELLKEKEEALLQAKIDAKIQSLCRRLVST